VPMAGIQAHLRGLLPPRRRRCVRKDRPMTFGVTDLQGQEKKFWTRVPLMSFGAADGGQEKVRPPVAPGAFAGVDRGK